MTLDDIFSDIREAGWRLYFLKEFKDDEWCASLGRGEPYRTTAFHRGKTPAAALMSALREARAINEEPVVPAPAAELEPEEEGIFG